MLRLTGRMRRMKKGRGGGRGGGRRARGRLIRQTGGSS